MTTLCVKFSADNGLYSTRLFTDIRQYLNPGHLIEVEQSMLAVELEPTDHVCVLYLLWTILVFCIIICLLGLECLSPISSPKCSPESRVQVLH